MVATMIPVELAEVGRRYRYRWNGGQERVGALAEIRDGRHPGELWCMFRDDADRTVLHGCAMAQVIEEVPDA